MKPIPVASIFSLVLATCAIAADTPVRHRILCCDYNGGRVAIVSAAGDVEWEFPAKNPMDCWLLPSGNVLFCDHPGAKEVTPDKKVVWEYEEHEGGQRGEYEQIVDGGGVVGE